MWAVLIVVVGLPVAIMIYFMCFAKSDAKAEVGRKKKNDDYPAPEDDLDAPELDDEGRSSKTKLNAAATTGSSGSRSASSAGEAYAEDDDDAEEGDEADGDEEENEQQEDEAQEIGGVEEDASSSDVPVDSKNSEGGEGLKKRKARRD
uniref:Uncharacterized protein n=1 Tax=Anopheles maculatus TaxID=74869 RepID=A0A182SQF0_9DIPT